MTENYSKAKAKDPNAVVLLHSGMRYYCYGRDIHILRDVLHDRVFTTSRDADGRDVYHFDRVNLSEVMCAVIRAGYRLIICDDDVVYKVRET